LKFLLIDLQREATATATTGIKKRNTNWVGLRAIIHPGASQVKRNVDWLATARTSLTRYFAS
jgi:hypothetical protein